MPAVRPGALQDVAVAGTSTSVCAMVGMVCWVLVTTPQTEHFLPSVRPVSVQVAAFPGTATSVCAPTDPSFAPHLVQVLGALQVASCQLWLQEVAAGVVTAGVVTAGVVTAGVVTAGVVTAGVVAAGVVTTGVVPVGVVAGVVALVGVVAVVDVVAPVDVVVEVVLWVDPVVVVDVVLPVVPGLVVGSAPVSQAHIISTNTIAKRGKSTFFMFVLLSM